MSSSSWLAVSATECTASASMAPDPVNAKPMNFRMAIPRLAKNAAMIARPVCAASGSGATSTSDVGDEAVEQPLLRRVVGCRGLRVPLHAHDPAFLQFVALEDPIVGPRG